MVSYPSWIFNFDFHKVILGTRWHSRLRHCATSQYATGSIPDGVDSASNSNEYQGRLPWVKAASA
jgi:hypothetical protein